MSHNHTQKRLGLTFLLNIFITVCQIIGGIISGSLALISDAIHNLSDGIAVLLAYVANKLASREGTAQNTFGYKRAEILAAFINALVLIAISFYLMVEAVGRFITPNEVDFRWMFWLGILGLLANSFSVFILHGDKASNLNVKAAYLHLLGDAMTSLAVIFGALFIWLWGWEWIDPLVTILISLYLLFHTYEVLSESTGILMQFAPTQVKTKEVKIALERLDEISKVYHIHLWRLTDSSIHFEAHVVLVSDRMLSQTKTITNDITQILKEQFSINHVTLQFEFGFSKNE